MAIAGHKVDAYLKTTSAAPSSSDLLPARTSTNLTRQQDEYETNYQGTVEKSGIAGQRQRTIEVEFDYEPTLYATLVAMQDGDTIQYLTLDYGQTGSGLQNPVKISGDISVSSSAGDKVTMSVTFKSQGAQTSVTIS
jgi:hypothetical protein